MNLIAFYDCSKTGCNFFRVNFDLAVDVDGGVPYTPLIDGVAADTAQRVTVLLSSLKSLAGFAGLGARGRDIG